MKDQDRKMLKAAAGQIEKIVQDLLAMPPADRSRPLEAAAAGLVTALRRFHETDPGLLDPEALERVEGLLRAEEKRAQEKRFGTGF